MAENTILSKIARTLSDVGEAMPISNTNSGIIFLLTVENAASDVGDTLDVFVQDSMDEGVTWNDLVHFTQVLGNGSDALKFLATVNTRVTPTTPLGAPQDAAMSAGVRQGPVGPRLRAKWTIVDSGTDNASFTFGVSARQIK